MPVTVMTAGNDVVVGRPATGSHAWCPSCGYGTVLDGAGAAILVHAASCPERRDEQYVGCDNADCRKVLDPKRVRVHGAKTCDDKCRAAAWKQKTGYGRPRKRANGKQKASGLQLSYRKAQAALVDHLLGSSLDGVDWAEAAAARACALTMAAEILRPALSEKQRKQLEARQ